MPVQKSIDLINHENNRYRDRHSKHNLDNFACTSDNT